MNMFQVIKQTIDQYNEDNQCQVNLASAAARVDLTELINSAILNCPEISTMSFVDGTHTVNKQQMELFTYLDQPETK